MVGLFAFFSSIGFFVLWFVNIEAVRVLEASQWPSQSFVSEPDYHPPVLEITAPQKASADSYLFLSPGGPKAGQVAPLIMTAHGGLVWNGPVGLFTFGFGAQKYKGEPVLLAWNGTRFPEPLGRGHGVVYLWNKHYELVANVTLEGDFVESNGESYPSNIDLHEQYITQNNTLLVLANNVTQHDLTSVGGPKDGWVVEGQVYEIDIETNEVLFRWKSLDHLDKLPFTDSVYPIGSEGYDGKTQAKAWGYFHNNAVTAFRDGYIISSRYFCSAIAVSRTGEVLWILSGRNGGDFHLQGGNTTAGFCYQHDIRVVNEFAKCLTISMHDNANCPIDKNVVPSSGKILEIDFGTKNVVEAHRYLNHSGLVYATAQGSHQRLENGNIFIGHGYVPVMEEFAPDGTPLTTWIFGKPVRTTAGGFLSPDSADVVLSYRAYKQPWIGCPKTKPSLVLKAIGPKDAPTGTKAYMSWNGATEVVRWEIWGGIETVSHITTVEKKGFETVVEIEDVQFAYVKAVVGKTARRGCGQGVKSEMVFVDDEDRDN